MCQLLILMFLLSITASISPITKNIMIYRNGNKYNITFFFFLIYIYTYGSCYTCDDHLAAVAMNLLTPSND